MCIKGVTELSIYFPEGVWYDVETWASIRGSGNQKVPAPLDKIPVSSQLVDALQRGLDMSSRGRWSETLPWARSTNVAGL
jgi:hypothetical protein